LQNIENTHSDAPNAPFCRMNTPPEENTDPKYILVVAEKPKNDRDQREWGLWFSFLTNAQNTILRNEAWSMLADNVWLAPFQSGQLDSKPLLAQAACFGIKCSIYQLAGPPNKFL
jgi:hypothetical protein